MGRPDGTGAGEPRWLVEEDTNRGEKKKRKKGVRRGRGSGRKKWGVWLVFAGGILPQLEEGFRVLLRQARGKDT